MTIVGGEERARRAREEIEKLWDEYITLVGMDDGYALALGKEKFFDAVATFAAEASGIGVLREDDLIDTVSAWRDHFAPDGKRIRLDGANKECLHRVLGQVVERLAASISSREAG